jgi:hypothetical protein
MFDLSCPASFFEAVTIFCLQGEEEERAPTDDRDSLAGMETPQSIRKGKTVQTQPQW